MARPVGNNLCITPEVGSEDMDPDVSTRMIILGPKANVSESEVVNFLLRWLVEKTNMFVKLLKSLESLTLMEFSLRREVLLLETLENAGVTDTGQERDSTRWRRNS